MVVDWVWLAVGSVGHFGPCESLFVSVCFYWLYALTSAASVLQPPSHPLHFKLGLEHPTTYWQVVYARNSQDTTSAWPAWLSRIFDGEWRGLGIRDLLNMRGKGRPLVGG